MTTKNSLYGARSIKRPRRTQAELDKVLEAALEVIAGEDGPITIRHLFYRLVSLKVIEKTETAYKALGNHLSKWRHSGHIAFTAFADNTRWYLGATTFDDITDALDNAESCYRKNLWADQGVMLEIWCEKDAVAGVIGGVADSFGVKTFVCRGFPSLTSQHAAAMGFCEANRRGKKCLIAYFGDHDPSGVDIDRSMARRFAEWGADVEIERVAITAAQIIEFDLPTRPVKSTDTRAKDWVGGCVEVDALPSADLRALVQNSITKHIDGYAWQQLQTVEQLERESLRAFRAAWRTQ